MPLYLGAEALSYKVFPATLLWTRAFGILWNAAALAAFYAILARLAADRWTAVLGVCLFALSGNFIMVAVYARPDLMYCALGLSGLAVYLHLGPGTPGPYRAPWQERGMRRPRAACFPDTKP